MRRVHAQHAPVSSSAETDFILLKERKKAKTRKLRRSMYVELISDHR